MSYTQAMTDQHQHPRPAHQKVDIILMEPSHGGNVGACARLLANFGAGRLILVRPYLGVGGDGEFWQVARKWAWRAEQFIEKAEVFDSLEEASAQHHLLVATVPPYRTEKSILNLDRAAEDIGKQVSRGKVAWVFGSERDGLLPKDRALCGLEVAIPTHPQQPDLNLAQTVALCLHASWQACDPDKEQTPEGELPARLELQNRFFSEIQIILDKTGYLKPENPQIAKELRKLVAKTRPTSRELDLVKGLIGTLLTKNNK